MDIKEIIEKLEKSGRFRRYEDIMTNILNDMTSYDLACEVAIMKLGDNINNDQFDLDLTFYTKTIKQIGNIMFLTRMVNGFGLVTNGDRLIENYIDSIYNKKYKGEKDEQNRSSVHEVKET